MDFIEVKNIKVQIYDLQVEFTDLQTQIRQLQDKAQQLQNVIGQKTTRITELEQKGVVLPPQDVKPLA